MITLINKINQIYIVLYKKRRTYMDQLTYYYWTSAWRRLGFIEKKCIHNIYKPIRIKFIQLYYQPEQVQDLKRINLKFWNLHPGNSKRSSIWWINKFLLLNRIYELKPFQVCPKQVFVTSSFWILNQEVAAPRTTNMWQMCANIIWEIIDNSN